MPLLSDGGAEPVVVDAQELRNLAQAARRTRADIEHALSRVAGIMGSLDRRGWNAGAADSAWWHARSGLQNLEADLDQHAAILDERATLVDHFETGQLTRGVGWTPDGTMSPELPTLTGADVGLSDQSLMAM